MFYKKSLLSVYMSWFIIKIIRFFILFVVFYISVYKVYIGKGFKKI